MTIFSITQVWISFFEQDLPLIFSTEPDSSQIPSMPWGFSLPHPANLEAANEDKINSYFERGLIRKGNLLQEHLVMYSEARYKLHFWIIHYFGLFVLQDPTRSWNK